MYVGYSIKKTIGEVVSDNLTKSERKPFKIEADRRQEVYNNFFQNFLKVKNFHHFARFNDKGPSIAEQVIRTVRNLLEKPLLIKRNANGVCELSSVTKQYNYTIDHSVKMTLIEASREINEKIVFPYLQDKRKKHNPQL